MVICENNVIKMGSPTKTPKRVSIGVFKTPLPVAEINDDERERQLRRSNANSSFATSASDISLSLVTPSRIIDDNEELKACLELFRHNKINKSNVWNTPLIDTLVNLVSGHRKYVRNFQVVGASLEASTKIYGIRVDYVYDEVVRMSGSLNRMEVQDGKSKNKESADDGSHQDDAMDEDGDEGGPSEKPPEEKPKKSRTKVQSSAVTQNKDTINAKLDSSPFLDPLFADLKTQIGDVASSDRAFVNNLDSENSGLLINCDGQYWDSTPKDELLAQSLNEADAKVFSVKYKKLKAKPRLRSIFSGYQFSDRPVDINKLCGESDSDDNADYSPPMEAPVLNASALALAFDMEAEVHPVMETQHLMDVEAGDFDEDFNSEDEAALRACTNLQRPVIQIESLQPTSNDTSTSRLEYSYRPLNEISKYWAGPSYWRFKPSINPNRATLAGVDDQSKQQKNTRGNKRKQKQFQPSRLDKIDMSGITKFDINKKQKNIMKTWDPKKLKLPTNYRLDENMFYQLTFAPGLRLRGTPAHMAKHLMPVSITTSDQLSTENVGTSGSGPVGSGGEGEGEMEPLADGVPAEAIDENPFNIVDNDDHHHDDNEYENEKATESPTQQNSTFLGYGSEFSGAPEKIEKIVLPFATRAKIVNMKQLKSACWDATNNKIDHHRHRVLSEADKENLVKSTLHLARKNELYERGNTTFYEVVADLPKFIQSKTLIENMSVPLAFSAMLHLANEHSLRFVSTDSPFDFKIIRTTTEKA